MRIFVLTITRPGYRDVTVHRDIVSARLASWERAEIGDTTSISACWLSD